MRTIAPTLLFVALSYLVPAQSFTWIDAEETGYEMNPGMVQYTVSTAPDNTVWFAGILEKKTSYYVMMGDIFLIRYDQEGNRMNEYLVEGTLAIHASETDPEGNLYLAGDLIDEDVEFWDGTILEWDGSSINSFLVKISPQGTVEWTINLNDTLGDYSPVSDMIFKQGMLHIAHNQWMNSSVSVVDSQGNMETVIAEPGVGIISGIDLDEDGNRYVVGSCAGTDNQFNGVNFPSPFNYDKHLVKYDPEGNPVWIRFVEDVTCVFTQVKVDPDGNIFWSGPLHNGCVFDTIPLEGPQWVYDFFLVKFNPEGDALWARETPQVTTGDAVTADLDFMRVLPDNSISLSGITRGSVDWGNGVVTDVGIGSNDAWTILYNSDGMVQWAKTGNNDFYTSIQSMDSDADGNLYFTGISHDTTRFDDLWIARDTYYYPYLVKLATGISTKTNEPDLQPEFTVYPNPAHDILYLSGPENTVDRLEVYDLAGRIILTKRNSHQIRVAELSTGWYFLRICFSDGSCITEKFARQ